MILIEHRLHQELEREGGGVREKLKRVLFIVNFFNFSREKMKRKMHSSGMAICFHGKYLGLRF
jgi:hypothetical protein